jgi:type VI secretion system protein ImpJ
MTIQSVHWHEGMFLLPQHSQWADRLGTAYVVRQHQWDNHYGWGLRACELDLAALPNYRFAVHSLKARWKDGTTIAIPDDGVVTALDVKDAFDRSNSVTVYLALPRFHAGRPNAAGANGAAVAAENATDETPRDARFLVDTQDLEDENTGGSPQRVPVRLLHMKLLLSTQDLAGYEVLPIARLRRAASAEAVPEFDVTYIPPVLACDAWQPLAAGILQATYDRLGKKIEQLAKQLVSRGISFDTHNAGDAVLRGQLQQLNQAYALLEVLAFAEGVHPLRAYLELCRLVGQLAIFNATRKAPALPRYDHDDLGGCFYRVRQYLEDIPVEEPSYEERPFLGADSRMQVTLEPKWLEPSWEMYVGVLSPLKSEDCIKLLTRSGQLDMKIGSAGRVDEIFQRGLRGLQFTPSAKPPRDLPAQPGLVYFQVNRDAQLDEWKNVQTSLTLAIRLNRERIAGNIQGQHQLTIKIGTQTTTMQFTLFLVPRAS